MNAVTEVGLIVERELKKNLKSVKGLILLVLSLLGGTGVTLLLVKVQQFKGTELKDATPEQLHAFREAGLSKLYNDDAMGHYLADAPEVLLGVLALTVWLTPMLIALMGFDSVSGEIQNKSVRYWTVRTRRASFLVGKFFGLWAVVSTITFTMHAIIWIVCMARGEASAPLTLSWGLRFWLVSLPISAAWCGIATLVGSLFRVPILALLVIFATFFTIWLLYVIGGVSGASPLLYVYPNYWDLWLLSPRIERALAGFGVCAAYAAAMVALGAVIFQRRDI
jgi:ABC-type transport system involved in multi-copper enzyme maturation permease subunit